MVLKKTTINESLSDEQRSKFRGLEKRIDEAIIIRESRKMKISISSNLDTSVLAEIIKNYTDAGWSIERKSYLPEFKTWLEIS